MESWVGQLQVPGLILAGGVIVALFALLNKMLAYCVDLQKQRTEERALLAEMANMLRQLCAADRQRGRE